MQDQILGAIVYFGSALTVAILAAVFTSPRPTIEPQYSLVQVDSQQCLADTNTGVLVTMENLPICSPTETVGKQTVAAR
jgi:hypothetical protein